MAKPVIAEISLQVPAGKAAPGQSMAVLSQNGLNMMDFCKAFNAKTAQMKSGMPIPVVISVHKDRTFSFVMKKPPTSYFLKEAAGIQKGTQAAGRSAFVARLSKEKIMEIVKQKKPDLNAHDDEAAYRMVCGSAMSMGIEVVGE